MYPNIPLKFLLDRLNLTPVRARGKSDSKTDRQTHRRIVQNHFSRRFGGCTTQIRFYLEVDFLHDANTSIDMEVKAVVVVRMGKIGISIIATTGYNDEILSSLDRHYKRFLLYLVASL